MVHVPVYTVVGLCANYLCLPEELLTALVLCLCLLQLVLPCLHLLGACFKFTLLWREVDMHSFSPNVNNSSHISKVTLKKSLMTRTLESFVRPFSFVLMSDVVLAVLIPYLSFHYLLRYFFY